MSRSGRHAYAALSVFAAGALVLTGCSKGGSDASDNNKQDQENAKRQQSSIKFGDAADSQGPAAAVKGAKSGGTMEVLQRDSFAHLDPAQIYVSDEMAVAQLIHRGLTGYKASDSGKVHEVVGDLATDSGTTTDGGKTWKYTLKDGLKFADGTAITSKDVRQTFERQFASFINQGPTYIQQWLANTSGTEYRKLLPDGPYKGKHLPDSVLQTPDEKTIVFKFKSPHPDLPYALAMAGYSVVSAKGDTKEKYDKNPVTTGPYKIQSFKSGKSMVLVKNTNWDPKSDPIRNQYVNQWDFTFNQQFEQSTKALLADSGADQAGISLSNQVDAGNLSSVLKDPKLKARTISGYQSYVGQMNINLNKPELKDINIRKAIAYALPVTPFVRAYGGTDAMEVAGGLISPTVSGYDAKFDPYGKKKKPAGDPAKAKALLKKAGKLNMKLTFGYINTPGGPAVLHGHGGGPQEGRLRRPAPGDPGRVVLRPGQQGEQQLRHLPHRVGRRLAVLLDRHPAAVRRQADRRRLVELLAGQRRAREQRDRPHQQDHRPGQVRGGVGEARQVPPHQGGERGSDRVLQADPDRRFQGRRLRLRRRDRRRRPASSVHQVARVRPVPGV